jgi:hypothetical protein
VQAQVAGEIRILVTLREFHGWKREAMWDEVKWEAEHFNVVERIADVGDESWYRSMRACANRLQTSSVRFFKLEGLDDAHALLNEGQ